MSATGPTPDNAPRQAPAHSAPPARALPGQGEVHRHVLVAIVLNKPGVLNRVASLMRARNFNIETLAVSHTDQPEVSRMTITLHGDDVLVEQAAKQLYRLIDVLKVQDVTSDPTVEHEIALIKVRADDRNRGEVLTIADMYKAKVVDLAAESLIVRGDRDGVRGGRADRASAGLRHQGARPLGYRRHVPGCRVDRGGSQAMTAKMYYDTDADPKALAGQKIVIIGYGSQGHAHAQNLHDSGYDVTVVEANPKARALAEEAGLKTADIAAAVKAADVIMILLPDTIQKKVYEAEIAPNMHAGQLLMFAHGFNIRFDRIKPGEGIDVGMVAPKGPGHLVRSVFEQGGGVPALFAVEKDASGTARARVLAYARGIGATRAGVLETTFKEETETDLFGEQVVLCGGVTELIRNGFETLVEAGYQPELAYFEVMHELKLIVDLFYRGGMNFMRFSVSDTAEYGDYVSGPRIIDARVRATMGQVLAEIQDGSFAARWIAENEAGQPEFRKMREVRRTHQIEKVGAELRAKMPFLNPVEVVDGQPQAAAKSK